MSIFRPLAASAGMSLIQVLVSIGIMGTMLAAFAGMQMQQARHFQATNEKMASYDLQQLMMNTFADGSVCNFQLSLLAPSALQFNPSSLTTASIDLGNTLYSAPVATSAAIAKVDEVVSPLAPLMKVASIKIKQFVCSGCADPAASNSFTASIQVEFKGDLIRPLKGASAQIRVNTTDVGGMKQISSCTGGSGGGPPKAGDPCSSVSIPNNQGVIMYGIPAWYGAGAVRCCAVGAWWGMVNGAYGSTFMQCETPL